MTDHMHLIRKSEYTPLPWKNNQGTTLEIIKSDSTQNFLWRLSAAKITGANLFSEYRGYDRLLTIWNGHGLLLNDTELLQNQIYQFKGEDPIQCEMIKDEVTDLGFIYRRDQIKAEMKCLNLTKNEYLNFNSDITFLFCAEGDCQISDLILNTGDTVKVQKQNPAQIQLKTSSLKIVQIEVHILK